MKKCPRCGETKQVSEFGRNAHKKDGLQSQCNSCRKTTSHAYYDKTKQLHRESRAEARERHRKANQLYVRTYLESHPCVDCGNTDIRVLQFDHLGDKVREVTKMMWDNSLSAVIDEIAKCEVRCANCHTIKTLERLGNAGWRC